MNDDCPGREATKAQHCWHPIEEVYIYIKGETPAEIDERCCWCGACRVLMGSPAWSRTHGPFVAREGE